MKLLVGIQNFLEFVFNNWTAIAVCIGLALGVYEKAKDYFKKSREEKISVAKAQIREVMLKMVSEAELDFEDWNKAGSIKRSQVISEIFNKYPILSKAVDQKKLIKWIDNEIDTSLKNLNDVILGEN